MMDFRKMAHDSVVQARSVWDPVVAELQKGLTQVTQDEALGRYEQLHRGRPGKLISYATRMAPKGSNPLVHAWKYEMAMEKARRTK